MRAPDPNIPTLIRDAESTNLLYIPDNKFPIKSQNGFVRIYLNDDGTWSLSSGGDGGYMETPQFSPEPIIEALQELDEQDREIWFGCTLKYQDWFNDNSSVELRLYKNGSETKLYYFDYVQTVETSPDDVMLYCLIVDRNKTLFDNLVSNCDSITLGWYTRDAIGGPPDIKVSIVTTRYVNWESAYKYAIYFTVIYHDPSGENDDVTHAAVLEGSPTPTPPTWTRDGYELVGWTPELAEIVTADVTYEAIWLTDGATQSPVTLSQARAWADENGYQSGTTLADADKMLLTYDLLAAMSGVVRLEYIEGTGTQYIDTGFKPTGDTRVTTTIVPASESTTETFGVFGGRTSNSNNTFCLWQIKGQFRTDYGATSSNKDISVTASGTITVDKNMGTTTINGVVSTAYHSSFTSTNTLVLFGINGGSGSTFPGSDTVDSRLFKGRMFETCVYDNGTLVRNLIPAKRNSDGAIGMYDTVHNQFYGNSGTGSFVAGPEIQNGDPMAADGSEYVTLEQFREWANSGGGGLSS